MKEKILIVDDEEDILSMIKDYLEINDYEVITASCGKEAIKRSENNPDLILLDINMNDIDGLEVCKRIRDFVSCPIIFLTARVQNSDKIKGFGAGGDDYIVKPFSIDELGARIFAHLRRERRKQNISKVKFEKGLTINYSERKVYFNDEFISFAKKEFDIIELLSQNPGQIYDKELIYERIWGFDSEGDSSVVAEHIRRIRFKLNCFDLKEVIETVWGVGYKWNG
ncbi:MAG: two-component system, OmpR family, lantibiotic biosynthesis response regulator NisR/SpaR [Oceanotoga sp.]|uniref:response regulator transcription factor n=1 Tax=Oceanotoga sp. TaxID=2108366 RepID=UPI00265056F7|nr:response regulator transcription factor [Oceanotoga sp.]MDN5342254.1 two-component system, OmpR family, lantibiotic biosynthesis response regulator NisR/SpaR [Oceanotoga sp.]